MDSKTPPPTTIDAYIAGYPDDVQAKLREVRAIVHEVAPTATEAIKYGIPTFVLDGKNLVHFGGYKFAKGTIRFPLGEPLPLDLIRRITAFRVQEIEAARTARKQSKAG